MASLFLNDMAQKLEGEKEITALLDTKQDGPVIAELVGYD